MRMCIWAEMTNNHRNSCLVKPLFILIFWFSVLYQHSCNMPSIRTSIFFYFVIIFYSLKALYEHNRIKYVAHVSIVWRTVRTTSTTRASMILILERLFIFKIVKNDVWLVSILSESPSWVYVGGSEHSYLWWADILRTITLTSKMFAHQKYNYTYIELI